MSYNPDIHHRRSIRLQGFDYSKAGGYFVTVCVHDDCCCLGEIVGEEVALNEVGDRVMSVWESLPQLFPEVLLDDYVIMPDHVHGIIFLVGAPLVGAQSCGGIQHQAIEERAGTRPAPTIGRIIGTFKSLTTHAYSVGVREGRLPAFERRLWQRNYYERIIRNDDELNKFRNYIMTNPGRKKEVLSE